MEDITRPAKGSRSGVRELLSGSSVAAGAIILSTLLDRPSIWYFILFSAGIIIAFVGLARLVQARKRTGRRSARSTENSS